MGTIAIIGATGTIGGRLARRLAAQGSRVRAICRNPGNWDGGVEPVAADLTDPEQAIKVVEGADGVYLTPMEGGDDLFATERIVADNVIDAALKHDVAHLVMHSAVGADRGDTGARVLDNKTPIEERVAHSGIGYTILRPAWFLQNLWAARDYLSQGVVSMPWPGDMVWAATDVEDIVTAASAFFDRGPANRGFDIHVPGGITGEQIAEAASSVLGRAVAYQQAPVTSREYVAGFPLSEAHKDAYAELFDYFQATTYLGDPQPITETLTGFRPRGIEQFLR
ncbi:MAG: NAD(P)H-binding protein, partial [Acidimicrobiia bacterium]